MAESINKITDLDPDQVRAIQAELAQFLQERYPEIDLSRGVLHDLVLYLSAVLEARIRANLARYLAARSLLTIVQDPDAAPADLVDHVFANYLIQRSPGAPATGLLTVVLSSPAPVVFAPSVHYVGNGAAFRVRDTYVAIPPYTRARSANEVVMQPRGDGTYKVSLPAVAVTPGSAGNIPRGTRLMPNTASSNFVMAYAETDFTGGVAQETTAEMMERLQEGIAAKAWSNRNNIVAMIRAQDAFMDIRALSIVGHGQPEMRRDQRGAIPISTGGKVDIYVRTAALPAEVILDVEATLVRVTATGGIWQFTLAPDACPGFYEVAGVFPENATDLIAGYEIVEDRRSVDTSRDPDAPTILADEDGAYSRYQTSILRFRDEETPVAGLSLGAVRKYRAVIRGMPKIAELQQFLGHPAVRPPAGDVLVRAPVPCWLTVNAEIQQAVGETPPDLEAIKAALATAVNELGFPGQLHSSFLADVVHQYLTRRQAVKQFEMQGRIRSPSGRIYVIRDAARLVIPHNPADGVSGKTTAFILDPRNIGLSVATEGFTHV